MSTHDAMRGCGLTSWMVCINDNKMSIRFLERNVTIRSEIWTTNNRSRGFHDIRECVTLQRWMLRSLRLHKELPVFYPSTTYFSAGRQAGGCHTTPRTITPQRPGRMEHKFTTYFVYFCCCCCCMAQSLSSSTGRRGRGGGGMLVMAATCPPAALTYLKVIWALAGQPQWPAGGRPEGSMGPNWKWSKLKYCPGPPAPPRLDFLLPWALWAGRGGAASFFTTIIMDCMHVYNHKLKLTAGSALLRRLFPSLPHAPLALRALMTLCRGSTDWLTPSLACSLSILSIDPSPPSYRPMHRIDTALRALQLLPIRSAPVLRKFLGIYRQSRSEWFSIQPVITCWHRRPVLVLSFIWGVFLYGFLYNDQWLSWSPRTSNGSICN